MGWVGKAITMGMVFYLSGAAWAVIPPRAASTLFREEIGPRKWDAHCADWPEAISAPEAGLARNPELRIEKSKGYFRVYGEIFFKPEGGEQLESVSRSIEAKLGDGVGYREWVMPGINEKLAGGRYFVSVEDLTAKVYQPGLRYLLGSPYKFKVLWFERAGYATMEFRREKALVPNCGAFRENAGQQRTRFVYRMTPRPDLLTLLMAEFWVLPSKERHGVRLRMRLVAEPAALVYELMPEFLLRTELESRARKLFENFYELRKHEAWAQLSKNAANPVSTPVRRLSQEP